MKQWTCLLLAALLLLTPAMALEQPTDEELKISAPSAILMERSTGTVLYEKNADEHMSPASVTINHFEHRFFVYRQPDNRY
jgi:D-alanyl-D-alanine carboxypeptidase (penicillin-binding protein 5/6)